MLGQSFTDAAEQPLELALLSGVAHVIFLSALCIIGALLEAVLGLAAPVHSYIVLYLACLPMWILWMVAFALEETQCCYVRADHRSFGSRLRALRQILAADGADVVWATAFAQLVVGIVAGVVLDAWLRPTKTKRKKQKAGGKKD